MLTQGCWEHWGKNWPGRGEVTEITLQCLQSPTSLEFQVRWSNFNLVIIITSSLDDVSILPCAGSRAPGIQKHMK